MDSFEIILKKANHRLYKYIDDLRQRGEYWTTLPEPELTLEYWVYRVMKEEQNEL